MPKRLIFTGEDLLSYPEYLHSATWEAKKAEAKKRSGYKCQLCGRKRFALQVHHNSYENIGNEPPEDLTCLCAPCHKWFHKRRQLWKNAPKGIGKKVLISPVKTGMVIVAGVAVDRPISPLLKPTERFLMNDGQIPGPVEEEIGTMDRAFELSIRD